MNDFHKAYIRSLGYKSRVKIYLLSKWLVFRNRRALRAERPERAERSEHSSIQPRPEKSLGRVMVLGRR
jgi:hypothetical protein